MVLQKVCYNSNINAADDFISICGKQHNFEREGQYFGRPIFYDGSIRILLVDFPQNLICIFQYDISSGKVTQTVSLPRAIVDDCYNLMLARSPLMLTRQGNDKKFQMLWPEQAEIDMGDTESFMERNGDRLYFCRWFEQPDYQEEIVVRNLMGEIIEIIPGGWQEMPDGQVWVLR